MCQGVQRLLGCAAGSLEAGGQGWYLPSCVMPFKLYPLLILEYLNVMFDAAAASQHTHVCNTRMQCVACIYASISLSILLRWKK